MNVTVRDHIVSTDVLIIGGGIAGLQAAIAASSNGVKVTVVEKADTRHSGSGGNGNDHFMCYIPEYHGDDFNEILQECAENLAGRYQDFDVFATLLQRSFEMVKKWESYGINMRPTGKYNYEGHAMPNRRRYFLKYDGWNQKLVLTKTAKEQGVEIINKTAMNELLVDPNTGKVIGAIGINCAEDVPEVIIFQTKAVIIATGAGNRLYPGHNPAYLFNTDMCPANASAGDAMSFRAGAELVNLELPYVHAGLKHFMRCGKATWIGVLRDINGKAMGPFVTKPTRELGDITADLWQGMFTEKMMNGTGPVYIDCTDIEEEDFQYMKRCFVSEGINSVNQALDQYGIDLRKEMIEFGTYTPHIQGLQIDTHAMTNVPGLYAAGDCTNNITNNIFDAACMGEIAGETAAAFAAVSDEISVEGHPMIQNKIDFYNTILSRPNGATWKESNSTLQQIMGQYVGYRVRSETLLKAAFKYVSDLKRYSRDMLGAQDAHELMRALEVLDMIDVAQAIILCAANRKETRPPNHNRTDYTYTNPLMNNKFQTIRKTSEGIAGTVPFRKGVVMNFRPKGTLRDFYEQQKRNNANV